MEYAVKNSRRCRHYFCAGRCIRGACITRTALELKVDMLKLREAVAWKTQKYLGT
jgi:hypothetical protein